MSAIVTVVFGAFLRFFIRVILIVLAVVNFTEVVRSYGLMLYSALLDPWLLYFARLYSTLIRLAVSETKHDPGSSRGKPRVEHIAGRIIICPRLSIPYHNMT